MVSICTIHLIFVTSVLVSLTTFRSVVGLELLNGKFVYENFQDEERDVFLHARFNKDFAWGVGTSAYQIEGAWNEGGRGPSIWDDFVHEGGHVFMNHTGDVACDSYHKIAEDVKNLKKLGVTHYRFSISWSRLLPDGTMRQPINPEGLQYYHRLIDALIDANIEPVVTLFHLDLPLNLQYIGAFGNYENVRNFVRYADVCFHEFGDKVKLWTTINEPELYVLLGHQYGMLAPGLKFSQQHSYDIAHNIILAHALTWKHYNSRYRSHQHGLIGLSLFSIWAEPMTNQKADLEAANLYMQMLTGWFVHPLYYGDYPAEMKRYLAQHTDVKLPEFTPEEKEDVLLGAIDFIGLNHYETVMVKRRDSEPFNPVMFFNYQNIHSEFGDTWSVRQGMFTTVPWAIRKHLNWMYKNYKKTPIFVTENNIPDDGDEPFLDDQHRIKYMNAYINEILKAKVLDGVDVRGYFMWSLMDNFEWMSGYNVKFGLHYVNFTDPSLPRIPRASAKAYSQIIQDNGFPITKKDEL